MVAVSPFFAFQGKSRAFINTLANLFCHLLPFLLQMDLPKRIWTEGTKLLGTADDLQRRRFYRDPGANTSTNTGKDQGPEGKQQSNNSVRSRAMLYMDDHCTRFVELDIWNDLLRRFCCSSLGWKSVYTVNRLGCAVTCSVSEGTAFCFRIIFGWTVARELSSSTLRSTMPTSTCSASCGKQHGIED